MIGCLRCGLLCCIWCYVQKRDDINEFRRKSIYAVAIAWLLFFVNASPSPYWIVVMYPFLFLMMFMNYDRIRINLLLESGFTLTMFLVYLVDTFWVYGGANNLDYLILKGIVPEGHVSTTDGPYVARYLNNLGIGSVMNVIYGYLDDYSDSRLNEVNEFKNEISDTIYSLVNDNSIENMKKIGADSSNSAFHIKRTDVAGVISYKTDSVCGLGFDDLKPEMFQDSYDFKTKNIKSTGLVGQGEPVCRIVTDDNWKIAVKIPEELYVRFIERDSISLYINDYYVPVTGSVQTLQRDSDYYVLISIDKYMSMYIDHRVLDIKFVMNDETGLKIPVSSKVDKAFYIVPMSVFVEDESYRANMLLRECSDKEGGFMYEQVYIDKFFTDNTYAYVDTKYLNDGDVLVNNETGERYSVHATGTIEGVFNVNKGFNQFVRIEKIRANGEYIIIRNNTPDGLRIYDHIALNAKDAQDLAIIY